MPLSLTLIRDAAIGIKQKNQSQADWLRDADYSEEAKILLRAARMSLESTAGYQAASNKKAVDASPSQSAQSPISLSAQRHLLLMLSGKYRSLFSEWLPALIQSQQVIPDELLPTVLNEGKKTPELANQFREALGERGLWLAQQGTDAMAWQWLVKQDRHPQEYDSIYDAWRDYLIRLREKAPDEARNLVEQYWHGLDGLMQMVILKAFATNLHSDDAPFLESLLENENSRFVVARLLMHLPESNFRQEAEEKLGRLLLLTPMGHRKQWVVDFAWSHAFDGHSQQIGRQEASELCTLAGYSFSPEVLLMILPLSYWYEVYGVDANILAEAAHNSTRPTMFYRIWTNLAMENNDSDFLFALVMTVPRYSQAAARALSPEQKEEAAIHWLEKPAVFNMNHSAIPLLDTHDSPWSETLGRIFLNKLEKHFNDTARPLLDSSTRQKILRYAHFIPLRLREDFIRILGISQRGDLSESEEEQANGILDILNFRAEMLAALEQVESEM